MATFILKSLGIGYVLVAIFSLIMMGGNLFALLMPVFLWQALLIVSALAGLVLKAAEENKKIN